MGQGFYDYPDKGADKGAKSLWPGLAQSYPQASETLHCMAEGVIIRAQEVDVGSILGFGFAPHTGGVASFVETIEGKDNFLMRADELAGKLGDRFKVPDAFRDLVKSGDSLYGNGSR